MAKKPLKQAVRDHLQTQSLAPSRLARLQDLAGEDGQAEKKATSNETTPHKRRRKTALSLTRAVAAVSLIATLAFVGAQAWLSSSLADRIAAEVARNHLKLKPADIESSNLREIGTFLSHLDFSLVQSSQLDSKVWHLQGARYCEILGTTAAQLRIRRKASNAAEKEASLHTVYQAPLSWNWFSSLPVLENGESPLEVINSGLRIRIWLERGVLFAMTAPQRGTQEKL